MASENIKPLNQILPLLGGNILSSYSANLNDEIETTQDFFNDRKLVRKTGEALDFSYVLFLPNGHFALGTEVRVPGSTFAISARVLPSSCLEGLRTAGLRVILHEDEPFDDDLQVYLTYVPDSTELIGVDPSKDGPICTCSAYRNKNRCYHVLRLFMEEKKLILPTEIRVGKPTRESGKTKPKTARAE